MKQKKKSLFVLSLPGQADAFRRSPEAAERLDTIHQYDLEAASWEPYGGLIFTMYADQHLLGRLRPRLRAFLAGGGRIFFNGHVMEPFLEELEPFRPMERPTMDDFRVERMADHSLYDGIDPALLNRRKGVAGFFGRGANPAPEGAQVVMAFRNGTFPVDWEYRPQGGGALYVHSGNDLWACMEKEEENRRFFFRTLTWLEGGDHAA